MLRQVPLFRENKLTGEEVEALAGIAEFHRLPNNYSLSNPGNPIDLFILVLHGELTINKSGSAPSAKRKAPERSPSLAMTKPRRWLRAPHKTARRSASRDLGAEKAGPSLSSRGVLLPL